MGEALTGLSAIWLLFLIFIGILWIILPFAVFGIKPRLDKIITLLSEQKKQNEDVNPELEKKIEPSQTLENCLKCIHKSDKKCKKTGYNLIDWEENQFKNSKKNPCEGRYYQRT